MFRRSEGIYPVFPPARVGGARRQRDLVDPDRGRPAGYGEHRGDRRRHCRHRHHQPAGNHHRLGQKNRRAGVPRHRLAVPPHQRLLRYTERKRSGGRIPGQDRSGHRRLFFRYQAAMDSGERAGRPGAGGAGRAAVRHRGDLAHLEAHRRQSSCDGLFQRLPHHAVQHQHPSLGR